ncbi:MAG: MFS transporter [Bullifex sp.]
MDQRSRKLQFWTLNAASFLGQCGISMVNLALVYHLRYTVGADAGTIGLAASTYTSVYLIACLLFSRFYQRFAPRIMVTLSVLGMSVPVTVIALSRSLPVIFSCLVLYGAAMSMLWPQMEAWITRDSEGRELNILTSSFNFSWSFGTGISPYVASLLVVYTPSLGLAGGVAIFAVIAVMITLLSLNREIRAIKPEAEHIQEVIAACEDHSTSLRFYSYAAVFLVYSALSVVLNIFPLYTKEVLHMSESLNGILLLLRGFSTCFAFIYFGSTSWWQFRFKYIIGAEVAFTVLLFVFAGQTSAWALAVFMIFFGAIFSLCYNFSIFHAASGAVDRGKRMMIHECVLTCGQVIGVSIGGGIYDRLGFGNVLMTLALAGVVMIAVQLVIRLLEKRKRTL